MKTLAKADLDKDVKLSLTCDDVITSLDDEIEELSQ